MITEHNSTSPTSTERLAAELSLWARSGQCILLSGELGSGKSTFARAFIRALAPDDTDFDVPSPSFSLVQTYENTRVAVAHVDLYRLNSPDEIDELGLGDLLGGHIVLIEWPEKLRRKPGDHCLTITFSGTGQHRHLKLEAQGSWIDCLKRNSVINDFIAHSTLSAGKRSFLEGDASSRRYESIGDATTRVLLMDMPSRPDGPIVKNNKPYSAIAHLAEGIEAVVAINDYLFSLGYSVPEVTDVSLEDGLAFIEPLGTQVFGKMMARGEAMQEPMQAAVEVLADIAGKTWPRAVPLRGKADYHLASYDTDAMMIEVDLLPSWFWPHVKKSMPPDEARQSFASLWHELLGHVQPEHPVWTLRDYHSPNLLWMPERSGVRRVGIIDTQDCVIGHAAYDVVSMLQDARVDIDFQFADGLYDHYCNLRMAAGPFDAEDFARAFAILGAQRATKILGIFARLAKRDGKPVYLKHIPRVARYLARNLKHPDLARLKSWYDQYLPLE